MNKQSDGGYEANQRSWWSCWYTIQCIYNIISYIQQYNIWVLKGWVSHVASRHGSQNRFRIAAFTATLSRPIPFISKGPGTAIAGWAVFFWLQPWSIGSSQISQVGMDKQNPPAPKVLGRDLPDGTRKRLQVYLGGGVPFFGPNLLFLIGRDARLQKTL